MKDVLAELSAAAEALEASGDTRLATMVDAVANELEAGMAPLAGQEAGVLVAAEKPTSDFIFGKDHPKVKNGKGHFPIPDADHARNALARANQFSSSPEWFSGSLKELKAAVVRAVKEKFPSIEVTEESSD